MKRNITYEKNKLVYVIITIYFLCNVFDAGGGFGVKYVGFVLVLVALFFCKKIHIGHIELILFVMFQLFFVIYSLIFVESTLAQALSGVTYCFAIVYALLINNTKIDIAIVLKIYLAVMNLFSMVIIVLFILAYVLDLTGKGYLFIQFGYQYLQVIKKAGFFGYGIISGMKMPIVYFRSSMFLLFGLSVSLYLKRKREFFLILVANFLVSTTANIFFSLVIILLYFLRNNASKKVKIALLIFATLGCFILTVNLPVLYSKYYEYFDDLFLKSQSSSIKIGHVTSTLEVMFEKVRYLLFGMGTGSDFYSIGKNMIVESQEVSQIECWRRFGTVYTVGFLGYIITNIIKLYRQGKEYKVLGDGLLILFIATTTNPQLMSPMFLSVLFTCVCLNIKRRYSNCDISNYTNI